MTDSGGDQGRGTSERFGASLASKARRRALLAALAALVALVGLGLPGSGCLNPRPEDLPSGQYSGGDNAVQPPETCDDNPALGGCSLPVTDDISDAPMSSPEPAAPELNGEPAPSDNDEEAPSAGAAEPDDAGDAGSEDAPADAGAP